MTLEIENWAYYTDQEKRQIIQRIEDLSKEDPRNYPNYK